MADIRENLIDILRKTRYEYRRYIAMKDYEKRMAKTEEEFCAVDDSIVGEIPFCADHLIAHGVTVQQWISVKDRLPDVVSTHKTPWDNYTVSIRVLCACLQADGKKMVKEGYCKVFEGYEAIPHWKIPGTIHSVTHWMPLPKPPGADMRGGT